MSDHDGERENNFEAPMKRERSYTNNPGLVAHSGAMHAELLSSTVDQLGVSGA